jgi:hypothetical protein
MDEFLPTSGKIANRPSRASTSSGASHWQVLTHAPRRPSATAAFDPCKALYPSSILGAASAECAGQPLLIVTKARIYTQPTPAARPLCCRRPLSSATPAASADPARRPGSGLRVSWRVPPVTLPDYRLSRQSRPLGASRPNRARGDRAAGRARQGQLEVPAGRYGLIPKSPLTEPILRALGAYMGGVPTLALNAASRSWAWFAAE